MEPLTITITTLTLAWLHFVNGVHGDAGVAPSAETLTANWVIANTEHNNSMNPADWDVPDAADAPPTEELLAAWHEARKVRALASIQSYMEEVGGKNARQHALASADSQISAAIEAEKAVARQYTTLEVSA